MTTERLLRKASQSLGAAAGSGVLAAALLVAPALAHAQYAVSDAELQANIGTALHNDSKLGSSAITAKASQGVVTLEGNVANEDARLEAEQVVAGVSGVRSIQDNLNIPAGSGAPAAAGLPAPEQSTQAPPPPDAAQATPPAPPAESGSGMPPPPPADQAASQQQQYTPYPNGSAAPPPIDQSAGQYPNQGQGQYPNQGQYSSPYPNQSQYPSPYPGQGYGYPQDGGYGPRGNAHPPSQPPSLGVAPQQQDASGPVSLPSGTLLSVRTTEPLSTGALKGGETFQATAASNVYVNGVIAIPRGAVITGQVVEAKNAGALAGSPKLDLKLTSIQLGSTTYPLISEVWSSQGPSKTGYTAANTAGGAVVGALIGAVAGGGIGAGIGAVAGGTSGALISGATHGPRLDLPPEALIQFHLAEPVTVQPVQYAEAERLAANAPQEPVLRQRPLYVAAPYPYPAYAVRPYPYPYAYYYPRY